MSNPFQLCGTCLGAEENPRLQGSRRYNQDQHSQPEMPEVIVSSFHTALPPCHSVEPDGTCQSILR
jgi:hypothetical protein